MIALNSLPLWGTLAALGVCIPILLHLLNKARPKKVNWAAMELLQKTTQRQAKKIKLEDWLLMLLRSLTLLLAALAMMRLVLVNASDLFSGSSRELIVAIDASYSMNHGPYESRFERAKKKAMKLIESLPSGSRLSLIAIGSQADVLIRHKDPSKLSMERYLSSLRIKPERFELEASLSAIEELVDESDLANREVIFLTDGQKRGWEGNSPSITERFAELSKKASISVLPLFEESHENLSVSDFHMASGVCRVGGFASLSAKVCNYGENSASTSIELLHDGRVMDVLSVGPLQPQEERLVRFGVELESAGPNGFELSMESDNLEDDNRAYLALDVPEKVKVLIVEGSSEEARYLELASRLQRSGYAEGLVCSIVSASSVSPAEIRKSEVIVLANVGDLSEESLEALRDGVRGGGGLLVYAGSEMDAFSAERTIGALVPLTWNSSVTPDAGQSHQVRVFGQSDPFGLELNRLQAEISDFQVSGYHDVAVGADSKILLTLDNGKPFLFMHEAGRGKVALFTTGPGREWSSLPLNPVGPILFHLLLHELSGSGIQRVLRIGESMSITVQANRLGAEPKLLHPDGQVSVPMRREVAGDEKYLELILSQAELPGFHELQLGENAEVELLAANLDSKESNLEPATVSELQEFLKGTEVKVISDPNSTESSVNQTHLGSFFALTALLLFAGQSALSTELTRRKQRRAPVIRTGFGVGVKQ